MSNRKKIAWASVATLLLLCQACKREEEQIAGKGGNATLHITTKHHSVNIDSVMVYLKYNATDKSAVYDDSARASGTAGDKHAEFSGLKKGKYFIYAKGYDPSIAQAVEGGIPYTINEEQVLHISLPVTEAGH